MNWSWKIGRLAGIDVYIHWTFLLLLGLFVMSPLLGGEGPVAALTSGLFLVALFGCIVLHELGHALMARRFGIRTLDITLLPIGGLARLERLPKKPLHELLVAVAGPAVNVVIAGVLMGVLALAGGLGRLLSLNAESFLGWPFLVQLTTVNILLVLFNMLPALPMDGGRVFRALLAMTMPYTKATRVAALVGQGMAVLFFLGGIFISWTLALVGLFVYFAAQREWQMAQFEAETEGVPAYAAMASRFYSLDTRTPLDEALELMRTGQNDFPVLDGGRYVGMLYGRELLDSLPLGRPALVGELTRFNIPGVSERDTLEEVLAAMSTTGLESLPVLRGGKVAGLLSLDSIRLFLAARRRAASAATAAGKECERHAA
ncbi:MAG: site-2 protease family protein [Planctomycetia bacterium]|nr:site-2 protease family protein [Planctomycetia bacterium]